MNGMLSTFSSFRTASGLILCMVASLTLTNPVKADSNPMPTPSPLPVTPECACPMPTMTCPNEDGVSCGNAFDCDSCACDPEAGFVLRLID